MTITISDYPSGKEILDSIYSGRNIDSTNGSNHNSAGLAVIGWEVKVWNSGSDKQLWTATIFPEIPKEFPLFSDFSL